jgi:TM2 domain-containing membrane protein YozV
MLDYDEEKDIKKKGRVFLQPKKNPGVAAVLSFLWVGLGQIYNGEIIKGILFMILNGIFSFLSAITLGIFLIVQAPFWIYGIYNAYKRAEKINERMVSR